jgi:hypothetical protein
MKTPPFSIFAVGLVLGVAAGRADDQPDAKVLLDNAIKAMGGEQKLTKLHTVSAKGKITGSPEKGLEIRVEFDGTCQGMGQYRADLDVQGGATNHKGVLVLSGDKGWFKKDDKTEPAPEGVAPFIQNVFYAGRMPQLLLAFRDKAYKLSPVGEVQVGTQAAVGLSISHNDRKDVTLLFDKNTGLPVKSEVRLADPKGKEIAVEFLYSDYKDFGGVKLSSKVAIKVDEAEFKLELSEIKGVDKVDGSQFARP